jgi:hypothetical protein
LEEVLPNLNAELIIWVDPYVLDRPWNTPEELDEKLSHMNCHTVGYVAKETDDFVVLAQGYSLKENGEDVEEWGHCWVLPKIYILNRQALALERGPSTRIVHELSEFGH